MNRKPQISHDYIDAQIDNIESHQKNLQIETKERLPLQQKLLRYGASANLALLFFGAGWG